MWLQIIEMLLPILLKIIEDSPDDQALAHMKRRGLFFRLRVANALRGEVVPRLMEALEQKLASMSDDEMQEVISMAKAAKEQRGAG